MKYSQFNSIIPYSNKFALYNTFEKKVIFLESELKDILIENIEKGIDKLGKLHPEFFKYLTDKHFLVDDETDEVEEIKKLVFQIDEDKKIYDLTINPTINCNFRCWYCYENHIPSSMNNEIVKRVNMLVSNLAQDSDIENFSLSFFGGEPLLYFEKAVVPIIDEFIPRMKQYNKPFNIGFTTNAYLINDKFVNYFGKKGVKPHFQITLDGYRENHDKVRFVSKTKRSYFTIINNIKKLIENEMFVRVRINYTDENIEDTYKIADDLLIIEKEALKNNLLVDFHRVWQNTKVDDIDKIVNRNVEIMNGKGVTAKSSSYTPDTVRGSCYADKRNSAVINYNGDVFKCTARDFSSANRAGYLDEKGDIVWENNSLEKRMNSKFHNKPCFSCRLLPICNGSCSQQALEHLRQNDFCIYAFDDREKDKVVKAKVDLIMQEQANEKE